MKNKNIQTGCILSEKQLEKLNKRSEETGNSRNSIIRTAVNEYFHRREHKKLGD